MVSFSFFLFWYHKAIVWVRFGIGGVLWNDKLRRESNYKFDECACGDLNF